MEKDDPLFVCALLLFTLTPHSAGCGLLDIGLIRSGRLFFVRRGVFETTRVEKDRESMRLRFFPSSVGQRPSQYSSQHMQDHKKKQANAR